jgi:uncharacterized NAD-dependent epimerase/dehydratase family protein
MTPHPFAALPQPYLLFLGDATEAPFAKTAIGLRDWSPSLCVGEFGVEGSHFSIGLPRMTPAEAVRRGAQALVIGVAPRGGGVAEAWIPSLVAALEAGLDLISGMHGRLDAEPAVAKAAAKHGRRLFDVRRPPENLPVATGRRRSGRRLLTVGTDCALGKKYTALSIAKALQARGVPADFRATGQTGILIAGGGLPLDAVVADFAAGAAEATSPDADPEHWDVIEGQGALAHPSYAGVSLALLHGSQPDVLVVCHEPGRRSMLGLPDYSLPSIEETIALNLGLGRRTNPAIRCAGVSLNTAAFPSAEAQVILESETARLGLPCADPLRGGSAFEALIDACLA